MSHVIEITDFSAPELDVYARLTEAQLRNRFDPSNALFIAESPKVIHRALDGGCQPVSMLMERKDIDGSAREILRRCPDIPVYTADEELLCGLTGYHLTRGVLCAMRRPPLPTMEAVCRDARRIVILENVQNPTSVGAIFRSAAALGMDAVLLTPGCSDPLYRRSARVSMGTVFQIPWAYTPANCHSGKCAESHQRRRHLPLRRRIGHGCGAAHPWMQRPAVPPQCPGQHGHGVPDPLDLHPRLAGSRYADAE